MNVDSKLKTISSFTSPSLSLERRGAKVIAIVGPTASGKTGIGVRLAKEFDGEIVSADSRQVFRGLNIGTGKEGEPMKTTKIQDTRYKKTPNSKLQTPNIEQLRSSLRYIDGIPQWMIDIVEPESKLTLFDYLPLARQAIENILNRGKLPIIVGGTGLYVQGLVEGFELQRAVIPVNDPSPPRGEVRWGEHDDKIQNSDFTPPPAPPRRGGEHPEDDKLSREQLDNETIEQLNQILAKIDPGKCKTVDRKNRHRLIRAIELAQEGLKPTKVKPDFEVLQIGVDMPRAELFERIDKRVDEWFETGLLEEVMRLLDSGVSAEWLMGLGLEYKGVTQFLLNCHFDPVSSAERLEKSCCLCDRILTPCSTPHLTSPRRGEEPLAMAQDDSGVEFEAMKQDLKFKTHQFARRQLTWLRRFPEINWLDDYKEMTRFVKIFLSH